MNSVLECNVISVIYYLVRMDMTKVRYLLSNPTVNGVLASTNNLYRVEQNDINKLNFKKRNNISIIVILTLVKFSSPLIRWVWHGIR